MPQYKCIKQENGKYTIEKVPVFGLGVIREFPYNAEWGNRMLARMQELKSQEYFAPVIFGHNDFWSGTDEKKACGFLDNFQLELLVQPSDALGLKDIFNGTIYADLIDIPEEPMQEIAALKYPYRSIEVRNETAEITALALLGGTEPFWKFPLLKVEGFKVNPEEAKDKVSVSFQSTAEGLVAVAEKGKRKFARRLMDMIADFFGEEDEGNINEPAVTEKPGADPVTPVSTESYSQGMGGKMPKILTNEEREQFKQEYGVYPDEIKSLKEQADQVETFRAAAQKSAKEKFEAGLTAEHVAPAAITIIGELSSYAAESQIDELRAKIMELVKYAKDGSLIISLEDTASGKSGLAGSVDFSNAEEVDAAVKAEMSKDPKLSYAEALEIVKRKPGKTGGGE